ncbi:MAG: phosphotransferase [Geminicoccaceae bacterium]
MLVRHHDVAASLSHLEEVEARLSGYIPPSKNPHLFRLIGDRLIREDMLLGQSVNMLISRHKAEPGLAELTPIKLASARLRASKFQIRSRAYVIVFKSNMRAFYGCSGRYTLKTITPGMSGNLLRNEIAARNNLRIPCSARIPTLLASNLGDECPYLLEETVEGWRPRGTKAEAWLSSFGLPAILDFYEENGVSLVPVRELLDLAELARKVETIAKLVDWTTIDGDLDRFLSSIRDMTSLLDGLTVVVAGHGDLALDNLLLGEDGRICLLDWERSGRITLHHDLLKLLRRYPHLSDLIEKRFDSWFVEDDRRRMLTPAQHALTSKLHYIDRSFDGLQASAQTNCDVTARMAEALIHKAPRELNEIEACLLSRSGH